MVILITRIEIGEIGNDLVFNYVNECEIESSWENLISTAKIVLPKNIYVERGATSTGIPGLPLSAVTSQGVKRERFVPAIFTGENAIIRKRDKVRIYGGYRYRSYDKEEMVDDIRLLFQGYVTRVDPEIPITIYCEDIMYLLKQKLAPSFTIEEATIESILDKVLPLNPETGKPFDKEAEKITVGKIKVDKNVSVLEVLEFMKQKYGIMIYYKPNVIYAGFRYHTSDIDNAVTSNPPVFHFQHNIIESSLEFKNADDVFYRVRVVNIKQKNKRSEKVIGDLDGETRTLHFYNAKDEDLESLGYEQLKRIKYTGYRGSFTTFLLPTIRHGNAIRIVDDFIEDRNGVYIVKGVKTTMGMGGGRQEIELDRAVQNPS